MGGRGSGGMRNSLSQMNTIKDTFIQHGLDSNLKGVRRQAEEGTGNYAFKDANPVSESEALQMTSTRFKEFENNVLVWGLIGDKKVFFAASSDNSVIKRLQEKSEHLKKNNLSGEQRPEIRTTTTYEKWRKRNKSNFDAWFGKV